MSLAQVAPREEEVQANVSPPVKKLAETPWIKAAYPPTLEGINQEIEDFAEWLKPSVGML